MALVLALGLTSSVRAEPAPVVLVPVVTDPSDEPRLLSLGRALRGALAAHQVPTVAARYTASLDAAKAGGDSFANALELTEGFALLRYAHYSDQVARDHARRLAELVNAPHAIVVAAPIANRFLVRRVSRGEGESITLPDPYGPSLVDQALAQLVPLDPPAAPPPMRPRPTDEPRRARPVRLWISASAGAVAASAFIGAATLATRRVRLGDRLVASPVDEAEAQYLARRSDWRALRPPMIASALVGAATSSAAGAAFASGYDLAKLGWFSAPAAAVGAGLLAWAAVDLSRGAYCSTASAEPQGCARSESQKDRGTLLALTAAPLLSLATTHLARWLHRRLRVTASASPQGAGLSVALLH